MTTTIKNLTPHTVTILREHAEPLVIESSGVARCVAHTVRVGTIQGTNIPITETRFGEVTGLPEPEENTILIVSRIVAEAVALTRIDCFIVNETVRDECGRIIGCKSLTTIN